MLIAETNSPRVTGKGESELGRATSWLAVSPVSLPSGSPPVPFVTGFCTAVQEWLLRSHKSVGTSQPGTGRIAYSADDTSW